MKKIVFWGFAGILLSAIPMAYAASDNVILGTPGPEKLVGTDEHDLIKGLGGQDRLWGNGDADRLKGGGGNDRLHGRSNDDEDTGYVDVLNGGAGWDRCEAKTTAKFISCEVITIVPGNNI